MRWSSSWLSKGNLIYESSSVIFLGNTAFDKCTLFGGDNWDQICFVFRKTSINHTSLTHKNTPLQCRCGFINLAPKLFLFDVATKSPICYHIDFLCDDVELGPWSADWRQLTTALSTTTRVRVVLRGWLFPLFRPELPETSHSHSGSGYGHVPATYLPGQGKLKTDEIGE